MNWTERLGERLLASADFSVGGHTLQRLVWLDCLLCREHVVAQDYSLERALPQPRHWLCAACHTSYLAQIYRLLRARLPAPLARRIVQHLHAANQALSARLLI
jgi:hypothetical protein